MGYTHAEKLEKSKAVIDQWALGEHTLDSILQSHGVNKSTFYAWRSEIAQIGQYFLEKRKERDQNFRQNVLRPLVERATVRLLRGGKTKTIRIKHGLNEKGEEVEVERIEEEKEYLPNPTMVIFAQKMLDPELRGVSADGDGGGTTNNNVVLAMNEEQIEAILGALVQGKGAAHAGELLRKGGGDG